MTNNPTIDGVSREDLDLVLTYGCGTDASDEAWDRLRALLDAPAVERQEPIKTPAMPYKMLPLEEDGWFQCVNAYEAMYPLYDGFAVARHSKRLIEQQESTIAQLQARVQELESGRGEIAGFRYRANGEWEWMDESPFADGRTHYKLGGEELQPLYAAPPAPVAVPADLHKRLNDVWLFLDGQTELNGCVFGEKPEGRHQFWWRKELRAVIEDLNACLDVTAALNGGK